MSSTVILTASGLVKSPNQLNLPDGSLSEANNVIIKRDGVIEPRRGFFLYGSEIPNDETAKQLIVYRQRILRHYSDKLQYDSTGNGDFVDFTESVNETESGLRIKSIESNGNLYLTTAQGIKKLSARNSNDLQNIDVTTSGGVKALGLVAELVYEYGLQTGFLPQDSTVAYRLLWNTNDNNNNLVRGTPSDRAVVYYPMSDFIVLDYLQVLQALDNITDTTNNTRINDGDYSSSLSLPISATASEILQKLKDLCLKLDNDIVYAIVGAGSAIDLTGATIEVNGGICTITKVGANFDDYLQSTSNIEITSLSSANQLPLNGTHTLTTVLADSITFLTSEPNFALEAIDVTVNIISNEYRSIVEPSEPGIPTTNTELISIQNYLNDIIVRLQSEPPIGSLTGIVISSSNQTEFIQPLDITTSANVRLTFTVPQDVNENYFYQLYRSTTSTATGVGVLSDLTPNDEMQQVYEKYYTGTSSSISFIDSTPDSFKGANLYTNSSTGDGITQANDIPPFAKDINKFRSVLFYANTRTLQRMTMTLLGVQQLIADITASNNPILTITDGTTVNNYNFVLGVQQVYDLTCVADVADSLNGTYFDLSSTNNTEVIRFYFKTSGGADTPPSSSGVTLKKILLDTNDSASVVASKVRDNINTYANYFSAVDNTLPTIRITNVEEGEASPLDVATSGFTANLIDLGVGENESTNTILVSTVASPALAVDRTARSLVRIINKNSSELVYGYYVSGTQEIPGKFILESKNLDVGSVYVIGSNSVIGEAFNPDISPEFTITNIDQPTSTITTSSNHNYSDGDNIILTNTDTVPNIDGIHQIEVVSATEFKITTAITTVNSNIGTTSSDSYAQVSENEVKSNRIYYSKYQEPEAVPIVNYFDVGAEDKEILRIHPLRDSLFVFKEDGIYRISGEIAPFNVQLFDSSAVLKAPDSLSVVDNVLYAWTEQGIATISESGIRIISRNIDTEILKLSSASYKNFKTATWGVGYESDNSYSVYTVSNINDSVATLGYRYSTLTNSWTNITKSTTCGIINPVDEKLYLGVSDTNQIEKERKNFDRTDYADREYELSIGNGKYNKSLSLISLSDVSNVELGDVITQTQKLSVYEFNSLLNQLDRDLGLALSLKSGDVTGYYNALKANGGDNLRTKIEQLAVRLDSDSGLSVNDYLTTIASVNVNIINISVQNPTEITTDVNHGLIDGRIVNISSSDSNPSIDGNNTVTVTGLDTFTIPVNVVGSGSSGQVVSQDQDFEDIKVCYNKIVSKLNVDSNLKIKNYQLIDTDTIFETSIKSINKITKQITITDNIDLVSGEFVLYKAIRTSYAYSPNTMGDPLGLKHLREAQMMFEYRNITRATIEFATDLLPQYVVVDLELDGNGTFGNQPFGEGFFGGISNSAPVRTYIPRNCQRCTYIRVRFTHNIARETYAIFATTMTGEVGISTRAYR